ncbi:predicted protein [Histoplasma capsulatum G186AR]|uniref:Uncharacterized protein n=1 Tax=Ajellomyces capsulatus (strain G186AR / H82 / ATCC MYA-2454 / RMSCC 2432) TaxID=447093 RepID=C0NL30_AJECG|nr:uncharacterized protein HCBG_03860 [Histoplasma capsulatum G186AR]EEH08571.1 predicted protein [Histoplasma capsulatum G186AR]
MPKSASPNPKVEIDACNSEVALITVCNAACAHPCFIVSHVVRSATSTSIAEARIAISPACTGLDRPDASPINAELVQCIAKVYPGDQAYRTRRCNTANANVKKASTKPSALVRRKCCACGSDHIKGTEIRGTLWHELLENNTVLMN